MIKKRIISAFNHTEALISAGSFKILGERKGIVGLNFHAIYSDEAEIEQHVILPHQKITVEDIRRVVNYYLEREFTFISPDDILVDLMPNKHYVLLSFDDGYANNKLALPILQEFNIPAAFFISIDHSIENKCFWPDAVYREGNKRGKSYKEIVKIIESLKDKKSNQIENIVIKEFGKSALTPRNDIDRPFTPAELEGFSSDPLVYIGNHTCNHAILTNYSADEVGFEVLSAQEKIYSITGRIPTAISFPNGNYSDIITRISFDAGLKIGVTTTRKKNYLPLKFRENELILLNRFYLVGNDLDAELKQSRSDIQMRTEIKKYFPKLFEMGD